MLMHIVSRPLVTQSCARSTGSSALLIVGPEGDFTAEELHALIAAGAAPVGLGSTRLRVETAALALLSVVKACCEART